VVLSFMPLFYAPGSAPLQYSLQGEEWPLQTNAFSILATLGETKAQGSVTFPSGAPDVSPVITHEAMTHPEDLARAKEAVELARRIGGSQAFSQPTEAVENGAGAADMWTAVYDGRGTCRMGKEHHDSVVDHELRVHGISGLRIVDGSVIPVGSPYLAVPEVLALAERASDLIAKQHLGHPQEGAAVLTVGVPNTRVTIARLSESLGGGFSMMQAVAYLAGTQTEGLLQAPQEAAVASAPTALVVGSVAASVVALAILATRRGKTEEGQQGYSASLLA